MITNTDEFSDLRIDGKRLWDSLMQLARIGATEKGGVCRLALTELDGQGRGLVCDWARALDCSVRGVAIGNIFMRRAGTRDDWHPVMTGRSGGHTSALLAIMRISYAVLCLHTNNETY